MLGGCWGRLGGRGLGRFRRAPTVTPPLRRGAARGQPANVGGVQRCGGLVRLLLDRGALGSRSSKLWWKNASLRAFGLNGLLICKNPAAAVCAVPRLRAPQLIGKRSTRR